MRRPLAVALVLLAPSACRLGGSDMPRAAPSVLVTDARSAFEMDPLLDVTLPPVDAGADAHIAAPAPAESSYRADGGAGPHSPRDPSGAPSPQTPSSPPPLDKPRPPQTTQSAQQPPAPRPPAQTPPAPTAPMPGMDHSSH